MAGVEADLKAGRYRNALRRRDVLLDGLGQARTYLNGESLVRRDQTPNLPTDIQKEILGSMREPSPRGWEELNRHYFERLTSSPPVGPEKATPTTSPTTPTRQEVTDHAATRSDLFPWTMPGDRKPSVRTALVLLTILATIFSTILSSVAWPPIVSARLFSQPRGPRPNAATRRVVIPFDFVSTFDDGEYGRTIGEMIWTKLRRQGGFILPESMQDVRDWCQRTKMIPGPDTPLTRMQEIVSGEQAGDIGIWGKIDAWPVSRPTSTTSGSPSPTSRSNRPG